MDHLPCCLLAEADPDSTKWVAILLGGFALVYLIVLRPMMRGGRKRDPLAQTPARTGLAQQRAVERDMQALLVEYEQMIRNMTAGLDTRAARLEALLHEADEKIAALRTTTGGPACGPARGPGAEAPHATQDVKPDAQTPTKPPDQDPRHAEVYALADQGLSATDVARRLGRPNGEIELILALRGGGE
jgi:DNA-binding NarL/FixJ family response regulator